MLVPLRACFSTNFSVEKVGIPLTIKKIPLLEYCIILYISKEVSKRINFVTLLLKQTAFKTITVESYAEWLLSKPIESMGFAWGYIVNI